VYFLSDRIYRIDSQKEGRNVFADSRSFEEGIMRKRRFWICLLALGISSVSVQLVMIREVMSSFGGNELGSRDRPGSATGQDGED